MVTFNAVDPDGNSELSCTATIVGADVRDGACMEGSYRFQGVTDAHSSDGATFFCIADSAAALACKATLIGSTLLVARGGRSDAAPGIAIGTVAAQGAR